MKLEYSLTNNDFLEHQLYSLSKSESAKKRLRNIRFLIPIAYLLFGLYLWNRNGQIFTLFIFLSISLLWVLLYPVYAKWKYKKHLLNHIKEHYANRINKPIELDFNNEYVDAKDYVSFSKINVTELKELIELPNHYFLKMTTDLSLVIPKRAISDQNAFKQRLADWKVDYVNELKWKWN